MDDAKLDALANWITEAGLIGLLETQLLAGFCARAVFAGLPIASGLLVIDTLHPVYEGNAVRWRRGEAEASFTGYGRTDSDEREEKWRASPFFLLIETGEEWMRRRVTPESAAEFSAVATARDEGMTDYVGILNRFEAEGAIADWDGLFSAWTTDQPGGFSDEEIAALLRLMPILAMAMKAITLARMASTLLETYLGRDACNSVWSGRIARGVADRIDAVLWFSDLRGYTKITDTAAPEQIIPLLNDYADAVISAVQEAGGDVLKLIGDGVLAIFRTEANGSDGRAAACRAALEAVRRAEAAIEELNPRREAEGLPVTQMYAGLHIGEVFFGNVGSANRLDFTVVGPAVNETSRIADLCRSADQPMLVSAAFAAAAGGAEAKLVSVGRYALRGVRVPQELFTLEPE
ncbi:MULTISPECIES: adenylate/guanylate cyclase domain-containing protein [Inquilinus]|uniref:Adenylate cyclase n=1 Tax=Inquilinus ginsengisoli TaxID=363840 RepID=A0ABU1JMG4_9PROT|nr:adenylate/guanylate cyclase domain-containing protein [Inquilinus ginsengisoli]MDR6289801.1 adenylate cyclase [Inquilinus ginsengisoli]